MAQRAPAEVLRVGEAQRGVVPVHDQPGNLTGERVVVDVVHAGDARGRSPRIPSCGRATRRSRSTMDSADGDQHAVQHAEHQHRDRRADGQQQLAAPEPADPPQLRDVDQPDRREDDQRAERGLREARQQRTGHHQGQHARSASVTSEYSCVRLPTAAPSAVRLPLELTGKPCRSEADVARAERGPLLVRVDRLALARARESPCR